MTDKATLSGYLVQLIPTSSEEDVRTAKQGEITYPLYAMLRSAYEAPGDLTDQVSFSEYVVYSSRLSSVTSGIFPFDDHLAFFYRQRPDFLCFSCHTWSIDIIIDFIRYVKALLPHTVVVLGGPHFNSLVEVAQTMNRCSLVDFVVRGPGEKPFAALVRWMLVGTPTLSEIGNLSYRTDGVLRHNEDRYRLATLDELPAFLDDRYIADVNPRTLFFLRMSLGCMNRCSYCSWDALGSAKRTISLSVDRAIKDLAFIFHRYPESGVSYVDAFLFGGDNRKVREFLRRVIALRAECGSPSVVLSGFLNYITADQEMLDLCKQALFMPLSVGLQAYDEAVWEDIHRPRNQLAKLLAYARLLKQNSFPLIVDLIFGLPTQTKKAFVESLVSVVEELEPDGINVGQLAVIPGSRYYDMKHDARYSIVEKGSVLLSTMSIAFDELRYLNMIIWGLRIGYEVHRSAFYLLQTILDLDFEGLIRNIAEFVCCVKGYEPARAYEDFYEGFNNPSFVDKLHRYFLEYLDFCAQSDELLRMALGLLIEVSRYDLARVKAKFVDPVAFFGVCATKGTWRSANDHPVQVTRLVQRRSYFLLSCRFDVPSVLERVDRRMPKEVMVDLLAAFSQGAGERHHYLFFGSERIPLSLTEFEVARFIAKRYIRVQCGLLVDEDSGECIEAEQLFIRRLVEMGILEDESVTSRRGCSASSLHLSGSVL